MTWPTMMFKHWQNMDVDDAGSGSVVSQDVWCPHCRNGGMVVLDDSNVGMACPMCVLGGYSNKRWGAPMVFKSGVLQRAEIQPERLWSWASWDSPIGLSWERGLTFGHTVACRSCGSELAVPGRDCVGCSMVVAS